MRNVNPFSPYLNETATYEHDDKFRDFLLRKMINGERQTMLSPIFKKNYERTIPLSILINGGGCLTVGMMNFV